METWIVAAIAMFFANVPAVLGRLVGLPGLFGALVLMCLAVPAFYQVAIRRRGLVVDRTWLMLLLFGAPLLAATVVAQDLVLALTWVGTFVSEVLLVYLLILNGVRHRRLLRRAIWALMIVGSVLSCMPAFQEFARNPQQQFAGFALRDLGRGLGVEATREGLLRQREDVEIANRALGPIGDPNRFAQVLLFVLPLAALRVADERSRLLRILAGACTAALLMGIFLTYSRGGLVALGLLIGAALLFKVLRWRHVIPAAILGLILTAIIAPGSAKRFEELKSLPDLLQNRQTSNADGALRGRMTETLAALNAFLDHPFFGVGPGHYATYYSVQYMSDPSIAYRALARPRRAHNLYVEMAAETGFTGVLVFLAAILASLLRLERARRRWTGVRPELARYAVGFELGILAYLATALFLHLSFQIYLGLFLGLSGAAGEILSPRPATAASPSSLELERLPAS